jgi:hypothetical protein
MYFKITIFKVVSKATNKNKDSIKGFPSEYLGKFASVIKMRRVNTDN